MKSSTQTWQRRGKNCHTPGDVIQIDTKRLGVSVPPTSHIGDLGGLPTKEIYGVKYSLEEEYSGHLGSKEEEIEYVTQKRLQVCHRMRGFSEIRMCLGNIELIYKT